MTTNPILKGFNPDPSICYANGRYYVAVSTFEYFPAVTIYESDDLVQWNYLTSALNRIEQIDLKGCKNSSGVYAPTLRHHGGRFYLVTTNKNIPMNFLVTADQIEGPWSDPLPIHRSGIDPSLFFDEDGSCFYTSNGTIDGQKGIVGAYIDVESGKLMGELRFISGGVTGHATEAPHIYKRERWYYLLIAEGGTEYGHQANILRSRTIEGPYEAYTANPILSHVNRKGHPIQATGHADLIQTPDGAWYAVFLGIRLFSKAQLHNLGRESFIAPVTWHDGWPTIGEGGHIELSYPTLGPKRSESSVQTIEFQNHLDRYPLLKLRVPKPHCYRQEGGNLTLIGEGQLGERGGEPTLLALRQGEFTTTFTATLDLASLEGRAGIVAWYNSDYHLKLQVEKQDGMRFNVSMIRAVHDFETVTKTLTIEPSSQVMTLCCTSDEEHYHFHVDGNLVDRASIATLCTETTMYMTFTGALLGIWAEEGAATFVKEMRVEEH